MSDYSSEEEEIIFTETTFAKLKEVHGLTDEELETFKKIASIFIKQESRQMNIMDMHGQTYFVAILAGFTKKGVLTYRKDGHIIGDGE
jgi:hypothetical protein